MRPMVVKAVEGEEGLNLRKVGVGRVAGGERGCNNILSITFDNRKNRAMGRPGRMSGNPVPHTLLHPFA